jgi:hypothetical protein
MASRILLPVEMRTTPTLAFTATGAGLGGVPTANAQDAKGFRTLFGNIGSAGQNNYTDSLYTASAEL